MKKTIQVLLVVLFLFFQNKADSQEMINGKIDNWQHQEATIVSIDLFSGDTRSFGKIDDSGNIRIPLQDDFLSKIKEEMKEKEKDLAENEKISLKNLKDTYSCPGGDLKYSNAELNLTGLPKFFFLMNASNDPIGAIVPASNPEIAKSQSSFGRGNTGKGKYMEWVYFDEEAFVSGDCSSTKYAFAGNEAIRLEQKQNFNLDFKKGWNLVEHEILEVFEDERGTTYPTQINHRVVAEMPKDVQWIFIKAPKR